MNRIEILLATYRKNSDRFINDEEVVKISDIKDDNAVRICRRRAIAKGYSFEVKSSHEVVRNRIKFSWRLVKGGEPGVKCVDEKQDPVDISELSNLRYRCISEASLETLEAVIELNQKGYWTYVELGKLMGIDHYQSAYRFRSLKRDHGIVSHHRGYVGERECIVTGVTAVKPKPKSGEADDTNINLLNGVFR